LERRRFDKAIRSIDHREEIYSDRYAWASRKTILPGDRLAVKISRRWQPCTAIVSGSHLPVEVHLDAGQRVALHDGFDDVIWNVRHLPFLEDPLDPEKILDKRAKAWMGLSSFEQGVCLLDIYRHDGLGGLTSFKETFRDAGDESRYKEVGDLPDKLYTFLGGTWKSFQTETGDDVEIWASTLDQLVEQHDAFTQASQWNAMLDRLNEIEREKRHWGTSDDHRLVQDLERDGIASTNPKALDLLAMEIREDSPSFQRLDRLEREVRRQRGSGRDEGLRRELGL